MSRSRMSDESVGLGRVVSSFLRGQIGMVRPKKIVTPTSNDCAYQSCTFLIDGISFK